MSMDDKTETYWWWWCACPLMRFAPRPTGVNLPELSSSRLSSVFNLRRLPLPLVAPSGPASGAGFSESSRLASAALMYWAIGADVTGLDMPLMLPTPLPIPANMRPNSLLMPGSAAGPGC
jgi:hypothetical protein